MGIICPWQASSSISEQTAEPRKNGRMRRALEEALLKQTEVQEKIAQEVVQGREPEPEDGFGGRTEDFREMPEARREEPPHLEQEEPVRETAAAAPAPKMAAGAPAGGRSG